MVQTVPKSEDFSKQFADEFSLIFRQNGDLGSQRTKSTPCPDEIESNLERLLFVWRVNFKRKLLTKLKTYASIYEKGVCQKYLLDVEPR